MSSASEPPSGTRHEVCAVSELPPGERTIVEVSGLSIGVFNVGGEFHALANVCPHQLAELCRGELGGLVTSDAPGEFGGWERDGEIVRCPHHKWAFDVTTGESVFNPHLRTRTFEVEVESGREGEPAAGDDETARQVAEYGTELSGEEPPVDTYDVEVEDEVVVLYV